MNVSKDELIVRIKQWILDKKKAQLSPDITIDLDTDLIEQRLIDSLMILDFLFYLEQLVGREMQPDPKLVKSLRSLRSIRDNIL